ncbi:MAG: hypothetical protein FWD19_06140 [Defluviitaleaceae bacterium]|nr:hypothetical protein [Defluviitaleaceae bacterium]
MKNKIAKIFFYFSFVPYGLLILYSIYGSIVGVYPFWSYTKIYGLEAFLQAVVFTGFVFSAVIPILPACLIYQLIYFFVLRKKSNREELT